MPAYLKVLAYPKFEYHLKNRRLRVTIKHTRHQFNVLSLFIIFRAGATRVTALISKIGLDRATYIQKMKPEVAGGGHIGVTTCQVAPIDRHMLNGKHRRNLALTFNVYRSGAYNCEILNANRPLRGFLTLDARGFLTLQRFARDFIHLKR